MTAQLITPNPDIACRPGYCLEYVRQAFALPARYGSATEAWDNSPSQHPDWNFPAGLWAPIWFAIDIEPNGHVALLAPDGSVYSSSDLTNVPHHHPSIDDLIAYYARWGKMQLTYRGWTEDVAGFPVISGSSSIGFDSITPQSIPTPAPQEDTLSDSQVDAIVGAMTTLFKQWHDGTREEIGKKLEVAVGDLEKWVIDKVTDAKETVVLDNRAQIATIPNAVANFNYRPGANIAGALDAIAAKPAGTTAATPPSFDVEALVARLKAELPAAIRADLAAKLAN